MCAIPILKEYWNLQSGDIVPQFILFKKASGLSDKTISDYKKMLKLFFLRFPDVLDYPRERTMGFLSTYENPSSYNIYFAYLKVFWDWVINEGYYRGDRHPLGGLKKRHPRGRIVQLSETEIARLLSQPDKNRYTGFRDYCLICLQIDNGIRPGETLHLLLGDFSPEKGEIIVRSEISKTRVSRILPLSSLTVQSLIKLLMVRPASWEDASLFSTETGTTFNVASYSRRVKAYGKKCGLEITAYHLRHAAALLLLRKDADAFTVQNILGHSIKQMTRHYINLTTRDVRKGHDKAGVLLSILGQEGQQRQRIRKFNTYSHADPPVYPYRCKSVIFNYLCSLASILRGHLSF